MHAIPSLLRRASAKLSCMQMRLHDLSMGEVPCQVVHCRATGATALVKLGAPAPDELGFAKSLKVVEIGGSQARKPLSVLVCAHTLLVAWQTPPSHAISARQNGALCMHACTRVARPGGGHAMDQVAWRGRGTRRVVA